MRLTGKACHLIGVEGSSPPLPYIEVTEDQGVVLIKMGVAVEVSADKAGKTSAKQPAPAKTPEPKAKTPPPPPPPPPPPVEETPKAPETAPAAPQSTEALPAAPADAAAPKAPQTAQGGEDRGETILHALDLVEPAQLEPEGDRQGKPTVAAIAEITGLADVTAAEIDAAVAKRAAA